MEEFKSGFALLAKMTNVPIIPVYLSGEYDKFIGSRKKALIDVPMYLKKSDAGMSADYLNEESVRFRNHMLTLRNKSDEIFKPKYSFDEKKQPCSEAVKLKHVK